MTKNTNILMKHEEAGQLPEVLILLAAAVLVVAIFRVFKLSPVLGFLFAGAAIGPFGLELIHDTKGQTYIAEFGVVFLLFIIGLELSFKKLVEMRYYVIGLGGLQLVATTLLIWQAVEYITGDFKSAIVIGSALALSSTAIVLQVLDERNERVSQTGRVSFAVLLMQDLAVIPLLVLVPILGGDGAASLTSELGKAFTRAMIVIVALVIIGRIVLPPFLSLIAKSKSEELFVATALLLALSASFATEYYGLSLALGAFIAGLLLSETKFQKQIEADILPFKGLLMGLFFMTVGMKFNVAELLEKFPQVMVYSFGLIVIKASVVIMICKIFRLSWGTSIKSGVLLAQGSEFAFILFNLALGKNLIKEDTAQTLLLVVSLTMALTPLLFSLTNYLVNKLSSGRNQEKITETEDLEGHIILIGFGWVGENLAKMFNLDNQSYVAIDQEVKRVKAGRAMNMPVYYGDSSRPDILESLQIRKAKAVIITIHDSKPVMRILEIIHHLYPQVTVIARAKHIENVEALKKMGASIVIPEAYESAIQIGKSALGIIGHSEAEVERLIKKFRSKEMESVED